MWEIGMSISAGEFIQICNSSLSATGYSHGRAGLYRNSYSILPKERLWQGAYGPRFDILDICRNIFSDQNIMLYPEIDYDFEPATDGQSNEVRNISTLRGDAICIASQFLTIRDTKSLHII